jgi:hypothetical protein
LAQVSYPQAVSTYKNPHYTTLNELLVVSQEICYTDGLTIRTDIIGDLYHCYALASADGTNILIIQNGQNLQDRAPIGAPRMGVQSPARDILSILHPTWYSYIYGVHI